MSVNFDDYVQMLAKSGEFWLFSVGEGTEWHFVLQQVGIEFFPECIEDNKDFGFIMPRDDRDPVYWARKSRLPIEVVEKRFGVPAEGLKNSQMVVLKPSPKPPVEPTVWYFGIA